MEVFTQKLECKMYLTDFIIKELKILNIIYQNQNVFYNTQFNIAWTLLLSSSVEKQNPNAKF